MNVVFASPPRPGAWPHGPGAWIRFVLGLAAVYALFDGLARGLGSDRGQAGFVVCLAVVSALVTFERWISGLPVREILSRLGLGRPTGNGLWVALLPCALMFLVLLGYLALTRSGWTMLPGWPLLLIGLFLQAGVAEEVLFRGYLYRRLREGRTFKQATQLARIPFVLVHLPLFLPMPWPVALLSVVLAALMTSPLAHLFELGGRTVWAPALLHFVVQGAIKVVVVDAPATSLLPIWMLSAAVVPFVVFRWPANPSPRRPVSNGGDHEQEPHSW